MISRFRAGAAAALLLCIPLFVAQAIALPHASVVVETPHGRVRFNVEVAADSESRMRGLMFRTRLPADAGMLFDFPDDHFRAFWMKNTPLPLDMVFIRADGTISSISPDAKPMSEEPITSREPVRAVLEINAGRAAALDIRPGEKVYNSAFANALPGQ
jgi:uncharacterized membrane protein (UPF0127 family)